MRQVEDINNIRQKHLSQELTDYTGLLVFIRTGVIPFYSEKKTKKMGGEYDEGAYFTIDNKVGKEYEVYNGSSGNISGKPDGFIDEDFAGAEISIARILPARWTKQANEGLKKNTDIRFYTLKVMSGKQVVYEDGDFQQKGAAGLKKGTEFYVYERLGSGGYRIGIRTPKKSSVFQSGVGDYDWTYGYIREDIGSLQLEVIDVSMQRIVHEVNQENQIIEGSLDGYILKVVKSENFFILPYPSFDFWFGLKKAGTGDDVSIYDEQGDFYFVQTSKKVRGYISRVLLHRNRSFYSIVSVPTIAPVEVEAEGGPGMLNIQSASEIEQEIQILKSSTIRYNILQKVVSGIASVMGSNPESLSGKESKDVKLLLAEMSPAEMEVLWAEHRIILVKAALAGKLYEEVLELIENTKVDVDNFKSMLYADERAVYNKLKEKIENEYRPENEIAFKDAFARGLGIDTAKLDDLNAFLRKDEKEKACDQVKDFTDIDMQAIEMWARLTLIEYIVEKRKFQQTLVRLIKTTPDDVISLDRLRYKVHHSTRDIDGNIYDELLDFIEPGTARIFYETMSMFYPGELDESKMEKFRTAIIGEDADSDVAIEIALSLSLTEYSKVTIEEKKALIEVMIDQERNIEGEEQTLIAMVLSTLTEEEEKLAKVYFENDFDRFNRIISSVTEEPYMSEIKNALDRIMGTSEKLLKKVMDLVYAHDQDAEDYALMLNNKALETLEPEQRVDLILRLSMGWSTTGFDEDMIIRVVESTKDAAGRKRLYEWLEEDYTPYPSHVRQRDRMLGKLSGKNKDRFLQAIGALSGTPEVLTTEEMLAKNQKLKAGDAGEKVRQLSMLSDAEMTSLTRESRAQLLDMLAFRSGTLGAIGEDVAIRIVRTTPDDQIDYLFLKLGENEGKLSNKIHKQVTDENFYTLQRHIQLLAYKKRLKTVDVGADKLEKEKMRQQGLYHPNVIPSYGTMGCSGFSVSAGAMGKIKVSMSFMAPDKTVRDFLKTHPAFKLIRSIDISQNIFTKYRYDLEGEFDAVQNVGVVFPKESRLNKKEAEEKKGDKDEMYLEAGGNVQVVPGIGLFEMHAESRKIINAETEKANDETFFYLEIILLAVGVGEIMMAARGLRLAFAIIDTTVFASHLAIRPFRNDLMKTEDGRTFLAAFDAITLAVGVTGLARLGYGLYKMSLYKDLMRSWDKAKIGMDTALVNKIDSALKRLGRQEDLYKKVFSVTNKDELKAVDDMIDRFGGLTRDERSGLKALARIKLKYPTLNGKNFLAKLEQESAMGNIVDNIVDSVTLTTREQNALRRFTNAGHGNLTEQNFIRTLRRLAAGDEEKLLKILQMPAVNFDLVRLDALLGRAGNNLDVALEFVKKLSGNSLKFMKMVDHLPYFMRRPVSGVLPGYFTRSGREFEKLAIPHVYDKHLMECFDFSKPEYMASDIDFFPPYTTQQDVAEYIDEALTWLKKTKGPKYPLNEIPEYVLLNNGITVRIGSSMNAAGYEGFNTIGMFYPPKSGGFNLVNFSKDEMLAYKYLFLGI